MVSEAALLSGHSPSSLSGVVMVMPGVPSLMVATLMVMLISCSVGMVRRAAHSLRCLATTT